MLSVSILGLKEDIKENINKLDNLKIDYFHVDVMDGLFVNNKTNDYKEFLFNLNNTKTKKDVHLMVNDVKYYVDQFIGLNPTFITFHYEAVSNPMEIIDYIKSKNIGVGISIKPDTDVSSIAYLLNKVDLVLVMSVEPGMGGQKFIVNSVNKINELYNIRKLNGYSYLIEVDGGINNITKNMVLNADILVVGSYITNGNYEEQISKFKM